MFTVIMLVFFKRRFLL